MTDWSKKSGMTSASDWIDIALDGDYHFRESFLRSRDWVVVPVESGLHFDRCQAERLASALTRAGESEVSAVLLEDLDNIERYQRISATPDQILEFNLHGVTSIS